MWFLTAIFQAVAQAVTWVLPVSESGHSAIFHDFSGRFSGNGSELTGLVHIGIALGIFLVFIKLFARLFGEFIAFFKDAFAKQNPFVNPGGVRRFMFGTVLGFLPMVLLLVPAGKYGNVYGLFRSMGYNGTLLDEGVFFALTGGLILLALLQMKKHGPQKNVDWYAALILGFAAAFSLPIAGLSYMGALFCLGVTMGVARKISYRFAAVSSVLTLLVLGVVEICTCVTYVNIIAGIVAVVLSAAVTYFMVKLMLWILHGGKLKAFAYYDFALAGVCVVVGIFELILR